MSTDSFSLYNSIDLKLNLRCLKNLLIVPEMPHDKSFHICQLYFYLVTFAYRLELMGINEDLRVLTQLLDRLRILWIDLLGSSIILAFDSCCCISFLLL